MFAKSRLRWIHVVVGAAYMAGCGVSTVLESDGPVDGDDTSRVVDVSAFDAMTDPSPADVFRADSYPDSDWVDATDAPNLRDVESEPDARDAGDGGLDDVLSAAETSDTDGEPDTTPDTTPDITPDTTPDTTPDVVDDSCARIRIGGTGGIGLNVRPDPSTAETPLGNLPDGTIVNVLAVVEGQSIEGNTRWYEIQRDSLRGFVSGVWATCMGPYVPPDTEDVFLLPFACGQTRRVTQGNNTDFSHNGRSAWSYDFSLALNTPVLAMQSGTVKFTYALTMPGHPCYAGGGRDCGSHANYVVILHGDGTQTFYGHLNSVSVSVGARVEQGQQIGRSGNTGWSTGPHLHAERSERCGSARCTTVRLPFADVPGTGMPISGQNVTSENGC